MKDNSVCDCVSELWVIYRFFFSPLVSLIYIIYLILSHFSLLFLTWSLFYGHNMKLNYILIYCVHLKEFLLSVLCYKWLYNNTKLTFRFCGFASLSFLWSYLHPLSFFLLTVKSLLGRKRAFLSLNVLQGLTESFY